MKILDFSGIMHASVLSQLNPYNTTISENLIRHLILNALRNVSVKNKEYGELIIAIDGNDYWRKKIFPYYKIRRKQDRESSSIDWKQIHTFMNLIVSEIKENFPYRVVGTPEAEGDDVIAVLVRNFHDKEPILIISADHDLIQLHNESVVQYDPIRHHMVSEPDPKTYLTECILTGDFGDGVPNVMMPDYTLAERIRQKPMTAKRLEEYSKTLPNGEGDDELLRNYKRNKTLIDLSEIPDRVVDKIMESYNSQTHGNRSKIFNYLIKKRMRKLLESVHEF